MNGKQLKRLKKLVPNLSKKLKKAWNTIPHTEKQALMAALMLDNMLRKQGLTEEDINGIIYPISNGETNEV